MSFLHHLFQMCLKEYKLATFVGEFSYYKYEHKT